MDDTAGAPEVSQAAGASRYEVRVDGELAGLAAYVDRDDQRIFYHTEIRDEFGGRGLGGVLVSRALADARAAGRRIVPMCPFVARWVKTHHDVDDVLDPVTPEAIAAVRERV
ncbi:GNAT family N-acetyltransferase [Pseudonocardia nematodicida]|uniref:GNAT family N-acetyltransferase n=1 Tax=Pseudonocardia nematodicida TaxID=1206997 RepID=A0ABV1KEN0_9PSEU